MMRDAISALAALAVCFSTAAVFADEETCVACDRKVLVSGQFEHNRGHESLAITGAPRRGEDAFREEIQGTNFSLSVPNLPAGRYTVVIGLAEVDYTNAGERVFDITSSNQTLARNLDVLTAAGGAGHVLLLTNRIDFSGDAAQGPFTLAFTGRINAAKLNTFELKDAAGLSLISMEAADLINAEDARPCRCRSSPGRKSGRTPRSPSPRAWTTSCAGCRWPKKSSRCATPPRPFRGWAFPPTIIGMNACTASPAPAPPRSSPKPSAWPPPGTRRSCNKLPTSSPPRPAPSTMITSAKHDGNSARYYGLTFWTPNINIFRDPRWGRGQETYGEDPFLTARLGVAFIRGLQGDDPKYVKAMACAKHFAVHSGPEPERHRFDAAPSERDFYETYLPQFEAAVREGHVGAVMGAYNSVYGKPACANPLLLTDLLRKQWGFDGHVVSDCGAIYDIYANHQFTATPEEAAAAAVKAGDDLCCGKDYNALVRAVKKGLISETEINTAVGRVLDSAVPAGAV